MGRILFSFFLIFIFLSAWGTTFGQQVVKVGSMPQTGEIGLYAAIAQGYFEPEGIKVELETVIGAAATIPAVVGGSLHMGNAAYVSAFAARAQGFDILIVFPYSTYTKGHDPAAIVVMQDSGIKSAKDLEGKRVALNAIKGLNWLYAVEWMSKNGADPGKVRWLEIPFPNMIGAVRAKQVDAVYAVEPFISVEVGRGGVNMIAFPFSEVDPAVEIAGLVANERWVKANPDLVERFARAMRKGTDYINTYPEKWPDLLARHTRLRPEWVPNLIKHEQGYPLNVKRLQSAVDLALKWGLLSKRLNVNEMVWPTASR